MRRHEHRFFRISLLGRPVTKWKCSCGIKVESKSDAALLEGK